MANQALILGQEYSFVDGKLIIAGVELFSCTTLKIVEKQTKTNNAGNSDRPVSRGRGLKEYEISFDLSLKDIERLKILSTTGMLTDLPMTQAIWLLNNGVNKHETIATGFEFQSDGIEMATGDTESRRTFDGICGAIESTILS